MYNCRCFYHCMWYARLSSRTCTNSLCISYIHNYIPYMSLMLEHQLSWMFCKFRDQRCIDIFVFTSSKYTSNVRHCILEELLFFATDVSYILRFLQLTTITLSPTSCLHHPHQPNTHHTTPNHTTPPQWCISWWKL